MNDYYNNCLRYGSGNLSSENFPKLSEIPIPMLVNKFGAGEVEEATGKPCQSWYRCRFPAAVCGSKIMVWNVNIPCRL